MKELLNTFGIFYSHPDIDPYNYKISDYTLSNASDKEKIALHRDFLKSLEEDENNRLTLLESKTAQLVSQTGIVFSLLSLFVPLLTDKISGAALWLRIIFFFILALSFAFYMLTIKNALKNFNVKNFTYSKSSPTNVIKYQKDSQEEFLAIEVRDLLYGINQNLKTNNKKATNLLHSYASFRMANGLTALLVCMFCGCFLLFPSSLQKIEPEKLVKIEHLDSLGHEIIKAINSSSSPKPVIRETNQLNESTKDSLVIKKIK